MKFREWILFNEIPYPLLPKAQTVLLPNERREDTPVTWDGVDMKFEDYWRRPTYQDFDWKRLNLEGFNAKFPYATSYLTFNARTRKAMIGPPLPNVAMTPPDWYFWARFSLGNSIVYSAREGIYVPMPATQTA